MGLRDEITEEVAAAFDDDLADAVRAFQASRKVGQGTYDPVEDTWVPAMLYYGGRGVFGSFSAELVDGLQILATDIKLLVLQLELLDIQGAGSDNESADDTDLTADKVAELITPKVDDIIDGMRVISAKQDPAAVTWTVQLRKV